MNEGKRWEDGRTSEWGEVLLYVVVGWDRRVTPDL